MFPARASYDVGAAFALALRSRQRKREQVAADSSTDSAVTPGRRVVDVTAEGPIVGIVPNIGPSTMIGSRLILHVQQVTVVVVAVSGQQVQVVSPALLQFAG